MKKMIFLLLSLLVASSAFAVMDEDPNTLGMYFDMNANSNCVQGIAPYNSVDMYVILTNPEMPSVGGFEFGYTVDGNVIVLTTVFSGQALDVGGPGNHIVGLGAPLMTSEATVLATMSLLYSDTTMAPVYFSLHGTEPSSIDPALPTLLFGQGELMTLGTSTLPGTFNATINGVCEDVVATEETSLDALKSLYR